MIAMRLYRFSRWLYERRLTLFAKLIMEVNNCINNSYIPYTAQIGRGTKFAYGGIAVVIHTNSIIGENCTIGQCVTIGGRTGHGGPPIISDNVYIGPGVRLLGNYTIGNNVVIGANSVVLDEVGENSIVVGIPGKVVSRDVSKFREENII